MLGQNQHTFDALRRMTLRHPGNFWVRSPLGGRQLVLMDPADIRQVLIRSYKSFAKGRTFANMKLLMGNGLIVQEGETWRRQRRMMQPLFYEEVLIGVANTMRRRSLELRSAWWSHADSGAPLNLTRDVSRAVLNTLLECIFGDDLARLDDGRGDAFAMLVDDTPRDLSLVPRFRRVIAGVEEIVRLRARHDRFPPDLLSMLILSRDKDDHAMPASQIRDEVATLIVAGHETTAALLTWSWHEIARSSALLEQIREEVGAHGVLESELSIMPRLPFLKKLVLEVLRLYPPVWLEDRVALVDEWIAGEPVPRGTEVFIPIYFVHRNPLEFSDPERLDPERFSESAIDPRYADAKVAGDGGCPGAGGHVRSAFMPFSLGPRRCIGDQFAILNAQVHLGMIARDLTFTPVEEARPRIVPQVNLRPEGGERMHARRDRAREA